MMARLAPLAPVVVIGGAGFIGCNLADSYARRGQRVRILDNLARPGSEKNAEWLKQQHGDAVELTLGDMTDAASLDAALPGAGAVFHLAAQVAVTTSMDDPVGDFRANAFGTLRVLEWLRRNAPRTPIVFASTNKVYGCLEQIGVALRDDRYEPTDARLARDGVSEEQPLDFRTPYGCSKGAADQYVLDYARSFGLRAAVLRMSCIYGPRQFGNEDQGWVAHFLIRALAGQPLTIYGDGAQVRDVLHVRDAVEAYDMTLGAIDDVRGEAFNLGGGSKNAISLRQLVARLAELNAPPDVRFGPWRSGDQPWFVADTRKIAQRLGWRPRTPWREGLDDLAAWARTLHNDAAISPPFQKAPV